MRKAFAVLTLAFFFPACASVPETVAVSGDVSMAAQWESGHFVPGSRDGAMIVVGVSGRLVNRAEEIDAARNEAARKVAMFHGFTGTVESFHRAGAGFFDFIFDSRIDLENIADYSRFADRLTFDPERDVLLFEGGTLVRFSYAANVRPVNFVGVVDENGRPDWIGGRRLPEIEGYVAAVGFSQNQVWLRDTVTRSVRAAAAGLLKIASTSVRTVEVDVPGRGSVTYIHSTSEGSLINFRVLEFWIEPGSMSVYTLGIARIVR